MKILIVHLGNPVECFISSSILKALYKIYENPEIYWVFRNEESRLVFRYNKHIKNSYIIGKVPPDLLNITFDKLINFSAEFVPAEDLQIKAIEKIGFNFKEESNSYYDFLYNDKKTKMNLFQIYFKLAGMTWRGEGYDVYYMPKNRSKKDRIGLAIANANLRNYIIEKLNIENKKLWIIPYKKNIFRKMDEINRTKDIITDDFLSMNISLFLRKNVYFLKTISYNIKLEFFGMGSVYEIPNNIIK